MKIKVCGMKYPDNILELSRLSIDFMGLIFYEKSSRCVGELSPEALHVLPSSIQKAGVFVNASEAEVLEKVTKYDLQAVQLHGSESPEFCQSIKNQNITIIKAFAVSETGDWQQTAEYEHHCDYFLFDTKTPKFGGSGQKFDWKILSSYTGETPFFLSGGIGLDDIQAIKRISHQRLYAIDLNSRFEIAPGLKDPDLLRKLLDEF
ncbi:MAG: phosphoribosylanthranilate isomerase [Candidatus Symbiothrix sp.]|jgi:phosphoribosylanthranilate isomerase|nr:phosphoribosylanthranilate isomerase [Candidatus Symbiothrix sp.]